MTRLRITTHGEISLRLDGEELLTGCQSQGRQLLKALVERHHGKIVLFTQLEREHALTCPVSTALKYLLDTVWPWSRTEEGTRRRMNNVLYTLPYDVSEDEALLSLKRVGKSEILLRLKRDHPDVWVDAWRNRRDHTLPEGTLTFLFTEIENCKQIWEERPEAMRAALSHHDLVLREAIESHSGVIYRTNNDGFCAVFQSAPDAVAAALTGQRVLQAAPWPSPMRLHVCMAMHTGAAELIDKDYSGRPLKRLSRLLAVGHGGQTLISPATAEVVGDALPSDARFENIGIHRLQDLQRGEVIFQLWHPDLQAGFPPLKSVDSPGLPNNLPLQLTSFIGREQEIAEVKALLARTRLLTLTGSGGCGKTRMMLQVAAEVLEEYRDGVRIVELASLLNPDLVVQAVGNALNIQEEAGQPLLQTIADHLKSSTLLLLLDNCEHLLDSCIPLTETLLRACPHIKVLASSREGLYIAGESLYRVPSLSMPDNGQRQTMETVKRCEAARLFIERAAGVSREFRVIEANSSALASICRRLDGIPLAIELAAARVRMLSVEEIDEHLKECLPLLTGGNRTVLGRHQTLRATLDWSYRLLTAHEQTMLARLSVFVGRWTLKTAEAICTGEGRGKREEGREEREGKRGQKGGERSRLEGPGGTAGREEGRDGSVGKSGLLPLASCLFPSDVLNLVTGLVDKSLVEVATEGVSTRYRLLETVRQYAEERLQQSGEAEQVRGRHRDWFLALAEVAEPQLGGAEQQAWLERLEAEHDNLRAALAWCREDVAGAEAGLRLAGALWRFWEARGYFREARVHLRQAVERDAAMEKTPARSKALTGLGSLTRLQGDYPSAMVLHEEALTIQRELGDRQGISTSLLCLGIVAFHRGEYALASTLHAEALAIRRELRDRLGIAASLTHLGIVVGVQGDYTQARTFHEEALAIQRELGAASGIAASLANLGNGAFHQGEYAQARLQYEKALETLRELGDRWGIATLISSLGLVSFHEGDYAQAHSLNEEALSIAKELGDRKGVAASLAQLGVIAFHEGDYARTHSLHAEALAIQRELGDRRGIAASLANLGRGALHRGDDVQARTLHEEALVIRHELGDRRGIANSIEGLADVALAEGEAQKAARLWGVAAALRESLNIPQQPNEQVHYDRQVIETRSAFGEAPFAVAWAEGRAMPLAEAIAYALEKTHQRGEAFRP